MFDEWGNCEHERGGCFHYLGSQGICALKFKFKKLVREFDVWYGLEKLTRQILSWQKTRMMMTKMRRVVCQG